MSQKLDATLKAKLKKELFDQEKELEKRIAELKAEDPFADPEHANDNAASDTDVREKLGHETIEAQILTLQRKLEWIKMAIAKSMKGKYGICESCKKPIVVERLKILPEARYCVECERRLIK